MDKYFTPLTLNSYQFLIKFNFYVSSLQMFPNTKTRKSCDNDINKIDLTLR